MTRDEILEAWKRRRPLRGQTGPGGAADFRVLDSSLRFAIPQAALLPVSDANGVLLELARDLPDDVPVLAGVCATDPARLMDRFLEELRGLGFAGVVNCPSVGWIEGDLRRRFEETGLGYSREADLVAAPPERLAAVARAVREVRPAMPVVAYGPEPLEDGVLVPASSAITGTSPSTTRANRS